MGIPTGVSFWERFFWWKKHMGEGVGAYRDSKPGNVRIWSRYGASAGASESGAAGAFSCQRSQGFSGRSSIS